MSFSCVVKTQRRWSNKIYKTELTNTRYNNQVLGTYRVDPQRAGLTLLQKEATIGHDRGLILVAIHLGCRLKVVESLSRCRIIDCGSIAPRSRFDRTAIVEFFHVSS